MEQVFQQRTTTHGRVSQYKRKPLNFLGYHRISHNTMHVLNTKALTGDYQAQEKTLAEVQYRGKTG